MGDNDKTTKLTLLGDPSGFVAACKVADENAKKLAASVMSTTGAFEGFAGGIGKITGLLGGLAAGAGLSKLISDAAAWNLESAKMARTMGITTEQSSVMAVALHGLGISNDVAENAALKLSRTLAQGTDKFDKFGITVKDSSGNLLPMPQIMANVNQKLLETQSGTDRNIMAMTLYGRSWGELQQILRLTPEVMNEAKETAERLHLVVGAEGVAKSLEYKKGIREIELVGHSLAIQLGNELMPAVISVGSALGGSGTSGASLFGKAIKKTIRDIQEATVYWASFADKINAFGNMKIHIGLSGIKIVGLDGYKKQIANINQAEMAQLAEIAKIYDAAPKKSQTPPNLNRLDTSKLGTGEIDQTDELYKKYLTNYYELIKRLQEMDPGLSKFDREMLGVYDTVQKLSDEMPQYNKTWFAYGSAMETNIKAQEQFKLESKAVSDAIKELEKSTEGLGDTAFASAKLYQKSFLEYQGMKGSQYSLTGPEKKQSSGLSFQKPTQYQMPADNYASPADTSALDLFNANLGVGSKYDDSYLNLEKVKAKQQYDTLLQQAEDFHTKMLTTEEEYASQKAKIDQQYSDSNKKLDLDTWGGRASMVSQSMNQVAQVMMKGNKEQFEAGKALAIAQATIQMFATEAAIVAGITASTGGWGLAAAIAESIAAGVTFAANIANISSTQYQGREFGGPVVAGQSYIVGEKRPELFTPGASGHITPYVPNGSGQSISVTHVWQVSTGVSETVQAELSRMLPMIDARTVATVKSAQRGGLLAA